jgi:hypothetical protein
MGDTKLTDELKQMNSYWRLLVGLVNECLTLGNDARFSPEERLERLRERLEFAQRRTRKLPASVRAELDANPAVQAVMADIARRSYRANDEDGATYLVMGDDGEFIEVLDVRDPDFRPLSDEEVRVLLEEME